MGQARCRGDFETRRAQALSRQGTAKTVGLRTLNAVKTIRDTLRRDAPLASLFEMVPARRNDQGVPEPVDPKKTGGPIDGYLTRTRTAFAARDQRGREYLFDGTSVRRLRRPPATTDL